MTRSSSRAPCAALTLVVGLCLVARDVRAHAPVPRRVALSRDAAAIALSLPGFGLLFRARADQPFAYVCDALVGLKPSELVPSLAFLADGSLLMGSADGVHLLAPDGCPRSDVMGELSAASVVALATRPGLVETAYAMATGNAAGLWRSRDGGRHWELRGKLDESELTNALVVSASDPSRLYVSMRAPSGSTVLASTDEGASWMRSPQDQALTLLSADGLAPYPLWAMARDALTVGNRGVAILRAQGSSGPWQPVLRVNYFGGLAVDVQGVIWVGDEIGGLYRSDDGGDSFRNTESDADVACLASAGDALWACTPGTPNEPALQRLAAGQPRSGVVALDAVERLVTCPQLDVSRSCAAAWVEWQRDVRLPPLASQDAGVSELVDAGRSDIEAEDAAVAQGDGGSDEVAEEDGGGDTSDASSAPQDVRAPRSDCSLATGSVRTARPTRAIAALSCLFGIAIALRRRRRA